MNKVLTGAGGGGGSQSSPTVTPDNLLSDDMVEFTLGICEGPIAGLIRGPKSFYLDDTPLMSETDEPNFNPFELHVYHGEVDPTPIRNVLGGVSSNFQVGVQLASSVAVTRTTSAVARGVVDTIEVRIVFNSLVNQTDTGDQLNETARFRIEYRPVGSLSWEKFYGDDLALTGKTTSGYTRDFTVDVPRIDGDWEVRVVQLSADNDPFRSVVMTWESIQLVTKGDRSYEHLAVVRGLGQAGDQFSAIPTMSGVYGALLVKVPTNYDPITRHYSGIWDGSFKIAHTDNPAWITYDLLMNETYGFKRHLPNLYCDRFSAYAWARWCDELVPRPAGGYQPRWTFNGKIESPQSGIDLLYYICGVGGAIPVTDLNGTVRFKVDRPETPSMVIGPESVTPQGFNYQFTAIEQRPNDITVQFVNPNLGWVQDVRRVFDQDKIDVNGRIPEELEAVGCNDVYEAQRRGQRRLVQANTETVTVSFQMARSGIQLETFDVIGIVDPEMLWGLSGRVKSVSGNTIYLRDPLFVETGTSMDFSVQTPSGVYELTVFATQPNTKELTISGGEWPADAPARAQFAIQGGSHGLIKPFRILSIEEDQENSDLISITALEQNVNKYGDVDNMISTGSVDFGFYKPDRPIAPVITSVQSGTAHLFVTGDGQVRTRILVEWVQNPRSLAKEFRVQYRRKDRDQFSEIIAEGRSAYIDGVQENVTYEIQVQAVGTDGKRSLPSSIVEHVAVGKTAPPDPPQNLQATGEFRSVRLTWDLPPGNPTIAGIVVYEAAVDDVFQSVEIARAPGTDYVRTGLAGLTTRYYWIKAVDRSGNLSGFNQVPGVVATTTQATHGDLVAQIIDESILVPGLMERIEATEVNATELANFYSLVDQNLTEVSGYEVRMTTLEQFKTEFDDGLTQYVSEGQLLIAQDETRAAAVAEVNSAYLGPDGAIAQSVQSLRTEVDDNIASLELDAQTIDGLKAQYTVKVDVNGYVAGYGLAIEAVDGMPSSEFVVLADRFAVAQPSAGGGTEFPFIISEVNGVSRVSMNSAFITEVISAKLRSPDNKFQIDLENKFFSIEV